MHEGMHAQHNLTVSSWWHVSSGNELIIEPLCLLQVMCWSSLLFHHTAAKLQGNSSSCTWRMYNVFYHHAGSIQLLCVFKTHTKHFKLQLKKKNLLYPHDQIVIIQNRESIFGPSRSLSQWWWLSCWTLAPTCIHQDQCGVQSLTQGHFDTCVDRAGICQSDVDHSTSAAPRAGHVWFLTWPWASGSGLCQG